MPHQLQPPDRLDHLAYFAVRYNRDRRTYELGVPTTGATYDLGQETAAQAYFRRVGQGKLGERAMQAAHSFGIAQANVIEQRAWGLDLIEADPRVKRADDELNRLRQFGEDDEDDVLVIELGVNNDEKVVIA